MAFFSFDVLSVNSLKCISMKNQECKVREVTITNDCMLYPFSIKVSKCSGNCKFLVNKKCDNKFVRNPSNYKCEYKKKTTHLLTEECE